MSSSVRVLPISSFSAAQVSPSLLIYRVVSRSRSGAVDVVGSAFTYLDSLLLQGSPVLAGLGGANSAQGTVSHPRRTLFRASFS